MSIKRVFISGATGSNGMTIAQHLKASGLEVICLVRNDSKPEVAELRASGCEIVVGDALDTTSYMAHVEKCDWVVWLAVTWGNFEADVEVQRSVLEALSRSSREINTKGFIQASGVAGYREATDPDTTMLDESAALQYEKASVEASLKLQRMIQQHPTVVGVTLRLGFTYSDRPQTHSGLFAAMFKSFDKNTQLVSCKGTGREAWGPVHVQDLAEAYRCVINADARNTKGQVFNICSETIGIDNATIAAAVASSLGPGTRIVWDEQRLWEVGRKRVFCSAAKAKLVLGWSLRYPNVLDYIPVLMSQVYPSGVQEFT